MMHKRSKSNESDDDFFDCSENPTNNQHVSKFNQSFELAVERELPREEKGVVSTDEIQNDSDDKCIENANDENTDKPDDLTSSKKYCKDNKEVTCGKECNDDNRSLSNESIEVGLCLCILLI